MSSYRRVEREDVDISHDGETIDVLIDHDGYGNVYIEIPVEYIKELIEAG